MQGNEKKITFLNFDNSLTDKNFATFPTIDRLSNIPHTNGL